MIEQYIISKEQIDAISERVYDHGFKACEYVDKVLQSLLKLEGEPVATMVELGNDGQTYLDWHVPTPPAGTTLFTHPPAPRQITAEDVTDEMLEAMELCRNRTDYSRRQR